MAGARIKLRISASAKRPGIVGRHGDGWKVRVAAPREHGRANAELMRLLADVFDVDVRAVRLVAGASSPDKVVAVDGLTPELVAARLDRAASR